MTVTLHSAHGKTQAIVIAHWTRETQPDPGRPVGVNYLARAVFANIPGAQRLLYVRIGLCPLFLVSGAHDRWLDLTGVAVQVTVKKADRDAFLGLVGSTPQNDPAEPQPVPVLEGIGQLANIFSQLALIEESA